MNLLFQICEYIYKYIFCLQITTLRPMEDLGNKKAADLYMFIHMVRQNLWNWPKLVCNNLGHYYYMYKPFGSEQIKDPR